MKRFNETRRPITALVWLGLALLSVAAAAAQDTYSTSNVRDLVRRVEDRTDEFRKAVDKFLDRSRLDGSKLEDDLNAVVKRFEKATNTLRRKSDRMAGYQEVRGEVDEVVAQGREVNVIIKGGKWDSNIKSRWNRLRAAINELGRVYRTPRI